MPNPSERGKPHLVLCQPNKAPGPGKWAHWRDHFPSTEAAATHVGVNPKRKVGIVPASLGYAVIDCDGGHFERVCHDLKAKGVSFAALPSSTAGNGHVWILPADSGAWSGNSKWGRHPPKGVRDDPKALGEWPHPHGEIRSDMGYVACRSPLELDRVLEGLDIEATALTPRDLAVMYGMEREGESKTMRAGSGKSKGERDAPATIEQLEAQLDRLPMPLCDDYDDWIVVLAIVKSECGEAGREPARTWSRKSASYQKRKFDQTWDSFTGASKGSGKSAGWGSLVKMAGGFNAKAGRNQEARGIGMPPIPQVKSSDGTVVSMPPRWMIVAGSLDRLTEAPDGLAADLIIAAFPERLRVTENGAYAANHRGVWTRLLPNEEEARGFVLKAMRQLAAEAAEAWGGDLREALNALATTASATWLRHVVDGMEARLYARKWPGVETCASTDFNRRERHKLIPLADGGAWDCRTGETVDSAAALDAMMALPWVMPKPTMPAEADPAVECAMKHYHGGAFEPLVKRAGAWISGTAKRVDVVRGPANLGKSTFIEALSFAFPSMIGRLSGKAAFSSGRFAQLEAQAARYAVVFVDEVDKVLKPITGGDLNHAVDSVMSVELKGKDPVEMVRVGTAVLLGNDFAEVDPTAPGVAERIQFVVELEGDPLSDEDRAMLLAPSAIAYLRCRVLDGARDMLARGNPFALTDGLGNGRERFLEERSDPMVTFLRENYRPCAKPMTTAASMTRAMADEGGIEIADIPKARAFGGLMRRSFGSKAQRAVGRGPDGDPEGNAKRWTVERVESNVGDGDEGALW